MKTSSKIILTTVITLGITSGVFAFGAHKFSSMSMHDKASMINERVTSKLDLNQIQQTNLNNLTDRMATIMKQAKEKSGNHKQMLISFINDEPLDQAALLEKINDKTSLVNQHAPEMIGLLATFMDSLDSEQKAEVKEMLQKKMSRHGKKHRRGEGYGMKYSNS